MEFQKTEERDSGTSLEAVKFQKTERDSGPSLEVEEETVGGEVIVLGA